jgi:hypothetical protein
MIHNLSDHLPTLDPEPGGWLARIFHEGRAALTSDSVLIESMYNRPQFYRDNL